MIDWEHYGQLLLSVTEAEATRFLTEYPNYGLSAFGYTFELANMSPAFSLVANSRVFFAKTRDEYLKHSPTISEETLRWSSGDYEYCAFWMDHGNQWNVDYETLHEHSCRGGVAFAEIYQGLVRIGSEVLATLASRGVLGDWHSIDFNFAEYCDEKPIIEERHRKIVDLINRKLTE